MFEDIDGEYFCKICKEKTGWISLYNIVLHLIDYHGKEEEEVLEYSPMVKRKSVIIVLRDYEMYGEMLCEEMI